MAAIRTRCCTRCRRCSASASSRIALGYEDINDHDHLRHDPVLQVLAGKLTAKRSNCAALAGKSTLNRLEHAAKVGSDPYHKITYDEAGIAALFVTLCVESY